MTISFIRILLPQAVSRGFCWWGVEMTHACTARHARTDAKRVGQPQGLRQRYYSDAAGGYGGGDVINGVWYMR